MQSQTTKIALTVVITAIVVGGGIYFWQNLQQKNQEIVTRQAESKTYSGDFFTVQYPEEYQVTADKQGIVTISKANNKITIGNFEPDAAPAPTPDMTQEQLDEFPKDIQYHGDKGEIASAIFYKTGDEIAKKELKAIQDSIRLKGNSAK